MHGSTLGKVDSAIGRIESATAWDTPLNRAVKAVALPQQLAGKSSQFVRDGLHGVWLGHPLHPMLVNIPIGTWTMAFGLDVLGALGIVRGKGAEQAADIALKVGAVGAVGAAMAGIVDWQKTHGRDRRTGMVHGLTNTTALGLNLASIALRSKGRRGPARLTSAVGWGCLFVGGYLGAHMVYRRRVGVDQADRSPAPRGFEPVLAFAELEEEKPRKVEVHDEKARQEVGVVLVRRGSRVYALGARCSHMGGPLEEGWVQNGALVCPWHGSSFDLETGRAVHGPSTCSQPRYDVRVVDGIVELKRQQEAGSDAVTPADLAKAALAETETDPTTYGKTAVEVLTEHHDVLRGLLKKILSLPAGDSSRKGVMYTLATEYDIHEGIEEKIFYPAVAPVSEDVTAAYAQHNELDDIFATTLRIGVSSPEFESHIRVLHKALDHHASSEEASMFVEAKRLGDRRLRQLGHELATELDVQRTSLVPRVFRMMKLKTLESNLRTDQ